MPPKPHLLLALTSITVASNRCSSSLPHIPTPSCILYRLRHEVLPLPPTPTPSHTSC